MSQIDKIGIQGIRSFGPDDMKKVEFFSPLTLILGQNGCGKTTIIESLKFITTGELPPGCGKGGAFVHDPKIAKETTVRGQIRLLFRNTKGERVTGSRIVEVVQKAKTLQFSTLDATFEIVDKDGNLRSISSKCADFKNEMTSLLGVAKPILENVIFCHQEESNWPLDEGKKVKDKFDAIFNATRYIKCLESMRKLRKDKKQAVNHMQEMIQLLRSNKNLADQFRKLLEDVDKNRKELKDEQEQLKTSLEPIKKRLLEIQDVEKNISSINGQISGNELKFSSVRETQDELRATQTEQFTCSDTELFTMIADFERNTHVQEKKQSQVDMNLKRATREIEAIKKNESGALLMMGKLEAAQKINSDNIKKRNQLLEQLVLKYAIEGFDRRDDFDTAASDNVLRRVEDFMKREKEKTAERKIDFERKESDLQKDMDKLRSEETTLEHDIATLSKQIDENKRKMMSLRQKLSRHEEEISATNFEELENSLEEIDRKLREEKERVNIPQLTNSIEEKKRERQTLERELEEVKKRVTKMNKQAEARSQFDIYVKDKAALEQKNQFLKRKNAEDFQTIFQGAVGNNVRNELEAKMANIRRQVKENGENKSRLEKNKTELMMKIENEKQTGDKLGKEIEDIQTKLEDLCGFGVELEDKIDIVKKQIDELNKKKGESESSTVMFRGFMEKIRSGDGCPLCHRDFDEGYDKQMLVDELDGKLSRLPHELTRLQKDLKAKEVLQERLLELRPQKDSADKSMAELDTRRVKLKRLYNDLAKVNTDLDSCSEHLGLLMSEEESCVRVQSDVVALDSNIKSIRQLTDKISNIQATLGATDDDLSMDDLMKHQSTLEMKVKTLRQEVEALQEEVMDHKEQLHRMNDRKTELSSRKLELKTKQQETEKMREEIEKLKEDKEQMEEKIEHNRSVVAPIKYQLKEKLEAKKLVSAEKDDVMEKGAKRVNAILEDHRAASDVHKCVCLYAYEGRDKAVAAARHKLQDLQDEGHAKEETKKGLIEEVNTIMKELTTQKERKRSLEDERKIRDKEVEAQRLQRLIQSLKEKIKDYDQDQVSEEKERLFRKDDQIRNKRANIQGKLEEIGNKKREYESNLNKKEIRTAEQKYREKFVEMKCIDVACNDLNKYYKALETAVMKFHQEKMSSINRIIRELWRTTYKGNDIDHIEIMTDESESTGADRRRTYHYRVVMVKNDTEMDMRGRCSAGQKVLASLIIRMALAETFSANCGILALDEPTTNLDRVNIEALATALLSIVNKRQKQKNLQLIVITHDEDFLEILTRADSIEKYFEVSRDERGLSVIKKRTTTGTQQ